MPVSSSLFTSFEKQPFNSIRLALICTSFYYFYHIFAATTFQKASFNEAIVSTYIYP